MAWFDFIAWDDPDDPRGNVAKIGYHGLTVDEVEHVLHDSKAPTAASRSSDRPMVYGYTDTGRYIAVVLEIYPDGGTTDIAVITAYEVEPPSGKGRRRR